MRRFFADTFYWVALLLRRDRWHRRVTAFSRTLTQEDVLFTTPSLRVVEVTRALFRDELAL
jgi:hypothetical protein